MTMTPVLTDEVQDALNRGVPLVALETTLVSHGFPGGEGVQVGAGRRGPGPWRRARCPPRSAWWTAYCGSGSPRTT